MGRHQCTRPLAANPTTSAWKFPDTSETQHILTLTAFEVLGFVPLTKYSHCPLISFSKHGIM